MTAQARGKEMAVGTEKYPSRSHPGGGRRFMIRLLDPRLALGRGRAAAVIAATVAGSLVTTTLGADAQLPPVDPFPSTTTTVATTTTTKASTPTTKPPAPATTAPPATTTTTEAPALAESLLPPPPTTAPAPVAPPPQPAPAEPARGPGLPGDGGGEGTAPPPDAGVFPPHLAAMTKSVRRTKANNTRALLAALQELIDLGVPRDEALRQGMGRFPVSGYATFSHDWWFPRFGPGWRLHMGTDIFAERGTPVRSPADGTVRLTNGGLGGISVYVVQGDGTYFYLAHLAGWAPGLADGHRVSTGDLIGYMGNSGNAQGGAYHVHFEYHPAPTKKITRGKGKARRTEVVTVPVRPGTVLPAVDPKAWLDRALADALAGVPALVEHYRANPSLIPAPEEVATPPFLGENFSGDPLAVPEQSLVAGPSRQGLFVAAAQPVVRVPLAAFAGLLVVLVGSLTPVFAAPGRLLPQPSSAPAQPARRRRREKGPPPGTTPEPDRPSRRRRRQGATEATGAAVPEEAGAGTAPGTTAPAEPRRRGRRRRS